MSKEKQAESAKNDNDENQEEDEVLTISDIMHINESLEREAEALLGGQNESVCTYPEGYKYRQPLYSCRTCAAENDEKLAGVCYACSGNCHDGHDLVELYTKRKFCCDCGNSKFKSKCKLYEEKSDTNALNKYNDNFKRIYCVCKKTYPPPTGEAGADDSEMHQCCVCEDWFHLSHIFDEPTLAKVVEKLQAEDADENWELLCKDCVAKLPFLMYYEANMKESLVGSGVNSDEKPLDLSSEKMLAKANSAEPIGNASDACKLEALKFKHIAVDFTPHSIYVCPTWREQLCRCTKCTYMYEDAECAFLLDPEDTFAHYDAERQRNMELNEEPLQLQSATAGIEDVAGGASKGLSGGIENMMYNIVVKKTNNRDAALNAYMGVKQMYSHLGEFFSKRGDGKTITRRDVEQCFEELKAKRPRFSAPSADDDPIAAAWTQGKVKKTQKCRNVLKKMIHKTDTRIKEEERKIRPKKEDEHAIKTKEAPRISSAMFLKFNTQLGPPFHIIVDTNFVNLSIRNKIDMMKGFMDCLYAKVIPYIPDCVMGELEKMGRRFKLALKITKDNRIQRLACTHKGIYADDCIVQRVTQHKCYIVATCDRDLRMRIRKIPGVPIMYIRNHRYTIERMPDAYGAPKLG